MTDERVLLTTSEVAQLLGITPGRVRQLVTAGELHGVKRAERWFFERDEIKRLQHKREAKQKNA